MDATRKPGSVEPRRGAAVPYVATSAQPATRVYTAKDERVELTVQVVQQHLPHRFGARGDQGAVLIDERQVMIGLPWSNGLQDAELVAFRVGHDNPGLFSRLADVAVVGSEQLSANSTAAA